MSSDQEIANTTPINTSGGALVDGAVNTGGGDFVGRDQITITEEVAYTVHGLANPYLGLRAFRYEDRAIYAGREQLTQETVQRLTAPGTQQTILFITGASGSGKSSFAQAGLIPLLENHYAAYQKSVRYAIFRPSSQPLVMLADALQKLHPDLTPETLTANTPKDQINLLLVDQFEELFIQSDVSQRAPFCDFLTNLPSFADCRTHILITLRVDYLEELFAIQPLWAIAKEGVELRTMSADDLRTAIEKPLQVYHPQQRFAPELLDRLVQDGGADAALLPLLQVTLAELWKTGKLVLANYHSLTNAIRQRAELVYAFSDHASADPKTARPAQDQQALMSILLDLINVSADGSDRRDARQRRTRQELEQASAQRPRLIEELVNARLLAAALETRNGEDVEVIDIIHESLIDNWERLRNAIDEYRQQLQRRAWFKSWLGEWLRNGRQDDYLLLTDIQLAKAQALVQIRDIEIQSAKAQEFYGRSVERREQEQQRTERFRRNTIGAIAVLIIVVLAVFVFGQSVRIRDQQEAAATIAVRATNEAEQRQIAEVESRRARANAFALQSQVQIGQKNHAGDLEILLAKEAILTTLLSDDYVTINADIALRSAIDRSTWLQTLDHARGGVYATAADFNADGDKIAVGYNNGNLRILDAETGEQVLQLPRVKARITGVDFSPDGQVLMASASDGIISLWNVFTGKLLHTFGNQRAVIFSATFSPDGKTIASGDQDNLVQLWDTATGEIIRYFEGHSGRVNAVDFSSDGTMIVSASDDNTVRLWNIATGSTIQVFKEHQGRVGAVSFNPQGTVVVSAGDDAMRLWSTETGEQVLLPKIHKTIVTDVAFSSNGEKVISGGWDTTVRIWDSSTGNLLKVIEGHQFPILPIAISPDDSKIFSASDDVSQIYDLTSDESLWRRGWNYDSANIAFSPDSKQLISEGNNLIKLWNVEDGTFIHGLSVYTGTISQIGFDTIARAVALIIKDTTINVWDVTEGELRFSLEGHQDKVNMAILSPDFSHIASASDDNTIKFWNVLSGKMEREIRNVYSSSNSPTTTVTVTNNVSSPIAQQISVDKLAFSSDGKLIASNSKILNEETGFFSSGTVHLWDTVTGNLRYTFEGSLGNHIHFSPDNEFITIGDTIFSTETGQRIHAELALNELRDFVSLPQLIFSPNSKIAAFTWGNEIGISQTGNYLQSFQNTNIYLWNIESNKLIRTIQGPNWTVRSLGFNEDGNQLISGDKAGDIIFWDVMNNEQLRLVQGHSSGVNTIIYSPDHKLLASASNDGTIRLWKSEPSNHLPTLVGHTGYVTTLAFSTDGTKIISGAWDGMMRIWDRATGIMLMERDLGYQKAIFEIASNPVANMFAIANYGWGLQVLDANTYETLWDHIPWGGYNAVTFSSSGKIVASAYEDVKLWDTTTGELLQVLTNDAEENGSHKYEINSLAFHHSGKVIASAGNDNKIHLWDVESGVLLRVLEGHEDSITAIAFDPHSDLLVSASSDQTLRMWNTNSDVMVNMIIAHKDGANAVSFSPDGKWIVSGGNDKMVRVWDVTTGKQLRQLEGHTAEVDTVAVSPDGKTIISGSKDKTIRQWVSTIDELLKTADSKLQRYVPFMTAIEMRQFEIDEQYAWCFFQRQQIHQNNGDEPNDSCDPSLWAEKPTLPTALPTLVSPLLVPTPHPTTIPRAASP